MKKFFALILIFLGLQAAKAEDNPLPGDFQPRATSPAASRNPAKSVAKPEPTATDKARQPERPEKRERVEKSRRAKSVKSVRASGRAKKDIKQAVVKRNGKFKGRAPQLRKGEVKTTRKQAAAKGKKYRIGKKAQPSRNGLDGRRATIKKKGKLKARPPVLRQGKVGRKMVGNKPAKKTGKKSLRSVSRKK